MTAGNVAFPLPPVWITKVGERSLYPVDCITDGMDGDYLCPAPASQAAPRPRRIKIDRYGGWVITLGVLLTVIALLQLHRPSFDDAGSPAQIRALAFRHNRHFAGVSVALMVVLAFASLPLYVVEIERRGLIQVILRWAVILAFASVFFFSVRHGRKLTLLQPRAGLARSSQAWAEACGVALAAGYLAWTAWVPSDASTLLRPVRATALTSGVSPLLPLFFLLVGISAWGWASHRLEKMSQSPGLGVQPVDGEGSGTHRRGSRQPSRVIEHRARFDLLFDRPAGRGRPRSVDAHGAAKGAWKRLHRWWATHKSRLLIVALWIGVLVDSLILRGLSNTGEGRVFDWLFYGTLMGLVLWIGLEAVRLTRAWKEMKVVLAELGRSLGGAFARIPGRISSWYLNPEEAQRDYSALTSRQIGHARSLLGPPSADMPPGWPGRQSFDLRIDLDLIEIYKDHAPTDDRRPEGFADLKRRYPGFDDLPQSRGCELGAIRHIVDSLTPTWDARPVARLPRGAGADQPHDRLVSAMEDLLALEAARWIGGALARIWTLVGSLVVASLALLLAITSYPFPEQSRGMTLIGVVIAALAILVLRIAIGTNRDETLILLADADPGKIHWNATLFGHLATYVVPLVGVLAALSFEATDLFRSVLGPILRLIP